MRSFDNRSLPKTLLSIVDQDKYATLIQRAYRGYVCRKVLKEKLRIDQEFRVLRQKYEVKS